MGNLKIVGLKAENVKGLKAIEIRPDENFQVISGKNGAGKSSVMDSIWLALGGREAIDKTERPVRNGAEEAVIEVDLGEFRAIRKFKSDGKTTIEVRSKEGAKMNSPQKLLDALIGKLSFDPFSFANLRPTEQRSTLLDIVGVDPKPFEDRREKVFQERTLVNREVEILEGQVAGMMDYRADGEPEKEETASAIMAELLEAQKLKKANDEQRDKLQKLYDTHRKWTQEIEDAEALVIELQAKIKAAKENREQCVKDGKEQAAVVDGLKDPDFDSIQKRLESVEQINKDIRKRNEYRGAMEKLTERKALSQQMTKQISDIEAEKAEAISKAEFPIEGLGFGTDGVTYAKPGKDPVPFTDVNEGDRLKVSVAMAMALNPQLRVIRIKEGSLLDKANMEILREMAKERDYQVWVEMVADDHTGSVGIYIEDGEIKGI